MLIAAIVLFRVGTKMEGKFLIGLLILGLISAALAKGGHKRHRDDHHHDDDFKCPSPVIPHDSPLTCTVTDDCGTYMCSAEFEGEAVTLSLKFDRSQEPMSAEIMLKVPGSGFAWKHTFKSGDKIQVIGFPLSIKGIGSADMYLTLTMDKYMKGISFKLDLYVTSSVESVDMPLLEGKLPMEHEYDNDGSDHHHRGRCSRLASWFKRQPGSVKAAVVISTILVFALIITGLVYCCKKRKAPPVANVLKVKPPSYDEATTTKTKVPLEPLVNEED